MDRRIEWVCAGDDGCQSFVPRWQQPMRSAGAVRQQRARRLTISEIITILICVHLSHYRHFKVYDPECVLVRLRSACPGWVRSNRFIAFIPAAAVVGCASLRTRCLGTCTGSSFIDAAALAVGNNPSMHAHRVGAG